MDCGIRIGRKGKSALPLLVAGVGAADHAHDVFALDDLAGFTHAFDGGADFHKSGFSDVKIGNLEKKSAGGNVSAGAFYAELTSPSFNGAGR